jgi:hypothetical protein
MWCFYPKDVNKLILMFFKGNSFKMKRGEYYINEVKGVVK